jgi:hypothetical protein
LNGLKPAFPAITRFHEVFEAFGVVDNDIWTPTNHRGFIPATVVLPDGRIARVGPNLLICQTEPLVDYYLFVVPRNPIIEYVKNNLSFNSFYNFELTEPRDGKRALNIVYTECVGEVWLADIENKHIPLPNGNIKSEA